jgi:hypothetical protein
MIGDLVDISRHHTDAVTALLATAGVVAYTVEVDVDTDDLTYPYTVVYPNPGTAALNNLAGDAATYSFGWQVTAVGRDRNEVQAVLDKARAVCVGARPVVAGRSFGLIRNVPLNVPIREDPQEREPLSGRPYFYGVAQFTVTSTPIV